MKQIKETDMGNENKRVERDRQILLDAKVRGKGATLFAWMRLSDPGWQVGSRYGDGCFCGIWCAGNGGTFYA